MPFRSGNRNVVRLRSWLLPVAAVAAAGLLVFAGYRMSVDTAVPAGDYIHYVQFDVPAAALERAWEADVRTEGEVGWVDLLSALACRYGGDWSQYRSADLDAIAAEMECGQSAAEAGKYFSYYREAYGAVLDGLLGDFSEQQTDDAGNTVWQYKYGLKAFCPIAKGFSYSESDDFGASRSYGYKRRHLGHDMMGLTGTPIVAVESGTVAMLGWNQYGGWRVGIRSDDGRRYWYYAHLRQDRPYAAGLAEGQRVTAGDVIGYMGRTGYSATENVSNIVTPHLHIGLELIFDESQFESDNEIWVNLYPLMQLLAKHTCETVRAEDGEYTRRYAFEEGTG